MMQASTLLAASRTRLENDHYVIELDDTHGGLRRIFDKDLDIDLLNTSELAGNELRSAGTPNVSSKDSEARIELAEDGPLRAAIQVRSHVGDVPYDCLISVSAGIKRIDFDLTVDYGSGVQHGEHRLSLDIPNFPDMTGAKVVLKDGRGLSVLFPVAFSGDLFVNQPFGVYQTQRSDQFTLDFADVFQEGRGFCLIHENAPGQHYDDGVLGLNLSQGRPLVVGVQRYRYSIFSHRDHPIESNVFRIAQSRNTPLDVVWPAAQEGDRPAAFSFLSIDRDNIVLSALHSEGDTIIARFYEATGHPTRARVTMPWLSSTQGVKTRLDNSAVQPVDIVEATVTLDFKPWEIVTLAIPAAPDTHRS